MQTKEQVIYDQFLTPIVGINADGKVVYLNNVAHERLPWKLNEHYSSARLIDISRHSILEVNSPFQPIGARSAPQEGNLIGIAQDGSDIRWFQVSVQSWNPQSEVSYYVFLDATHLVSTIHLQEQRLAALSISETKAKIGSWRFEINTQKIEWSPEVFRIFRYNSVTEPSFETYLSFLNVDEQNELKHHIKMAIEKKRAYEVVQHLSTTDGPRVVRAWGQPQVGSDGGVEVLFGTVSDITESIREIEQLRGIAAVAEKTSTAVVITDAAGKTEWVNDGFVAMTGYSLAEVKGRKPGSVLQGSKTNRETVSLMSETLKRGRPLDVEILNYRKNGAPYWNRLIIHPTFRTDGKLDKFYAIQLDVTERRKLYETIQRRSEQLKNAVAIKDRMFSVIGHDLRGTFTTILGYSRLLTDDIECLGTAEIKTYAQHILAGASQNLLLVDNLLQWALSHSDRIQPQSNNVNVANEIDAVIKAHAFLLEQKRLKVMKNVPSNVLITVDQQMLSSIIKNLLTNAIKFSPPEGNIAIICEKDDSAFTLKIEDEGRGLTLEQAQRVFSDHPLSSTVGSGGEVGSGLGLSLVNQFVKAHGGYARAYPRSAGGLCVEVVFPYAARGKKA